MTNDHPSKSCPHGRCINHSPDPKTRPIGTKTKPTRNSNLLLPVAAISAVIWIVSITALQVAEVKKHDAFQLKQGELLDSTKEYCGTSYLDWLLNMSPAKTANWGARFCANGRYSEVNRREYEHEMQRIEKQWQKKLIMFASLEAWIALLGAAFWAGQFSFCCWRPRQCLKEIVRLESYCGLCGRVLNRWSRVEKVFCEPCYCCGRT